MFYLTTHSTHFIFTVIWRQTWLRTILIVRKETRCRHIGYSFRLTARVLLYALSHRQDSTYHDLCYTSRGGLAGTRNRSMGSPHEGSIRRPIAPWANALTTELSVFECRINVVALATMEWTDLLGFEVHALVKHKAVLAQSHCDICSSYRPWNHQYTENWAMIANKYSTRF